MANPIELFKNRKDRFSYYKGHDGETSGSSEIIIAKPGEENNPNIGDRTAYRIITEDGDTIVPIYRYGEYSGLNTSPIMIYDKNHPNFKSLNDFFDYIKNSRQLDRYGNYFDEVELVFNRNK